MKRNKVMIICGASRRLLDLQDPHPVMLGVSSRQPPSCSGSAALGGMMARVPGSFNGQDETYKVIFYPVCTVIGATRVYGLSRCSTDYTTEAAGAELPAQLQCQRVAAFSRIAPSGRTGNFWRKMNDPISCIIDPGAIEVTASPKWSDVHFLQASHLVSFPAL